MSDQVQPNNCNPVDNLVFSDVYRHFIIFCKRFTDEMKIVEYRDIRQFILIGVHSRTSWSAVQMLVVRLVFVVAQNRF